MKKYTFSILNWIMYYFSLLIVGGMFCIFLILFINAYIDKLPEAYFPIPFAVIISAVFTYVVLGLPHTYEIEITDRTLRCYSLLCDYEIPIDLIRSIILPSGYSRAQIGSIDFGTKKVFIDAEFKGIDDLMAELLEIKHDIKIKRSWFSPFG